MWIANKPLIARVATNPRLVLREMELTQYAQNSSSVFVGASININPEAPIVQPEQHPTPWIEIIRNIRQKRASSSYFFPEVSMVARVDPGPVAGTLCFTERGGLSEQLISYNEEDADFRLGHISHFGSPCLSLSHEESEVFTVDSDMPIDPTQRFVVVLPYRKAPRSWTRVPGALASN